MFVLYCDCGFTAEPDTAIANRCPDCERKLKIVSGESEEVLKFVKEREDK